ncbi:hypothetical protein F4861DRAFT_498434 [Xylaria intraflava]|nr:hypothetical protein F4861DRAFT_498434 [Xylaria intraflava]
MAPLTRRAAKALDSSAKQESVDTTPKSAKEPTFTESVVLRSKRKAPTEPDKADKEPGAGRAEGKAMPRRGKLEVSIVDNATPSKAKKSPIEVQIPNSAVMTPTPHSRASSIADSQNTDVVDEGNLTLIMSASKQLEEEASQKLESLSRLRSESGPESTPSTKAHKSTDVTSLGKAQEEPALQSSAQSQSQPAEPEAEAQATPQPAAAKSTHVVFGDDDDVDKFVAAAAAKTKNGSDDDSGDEDGEQVAAEEEEEESDDEAPEAVSTATAARETLKSARAAIEAAEKYAASTKRKRQARDNLLKKQAETRKRARETTDSAPGEADGSSEDEQNTRSKRQRRSQNLPDVLPAEFLTDSSDGEDDESTLKKMVKRPQKITFETAMQALDIEGRGPRDEVVGSTRYRVLAGEGDQRLPPKANKQSRRVKEDLLRRGRQRVATNKKRGFFVKR